MRVSKEVQQKIEEAIATGYAVEHSAIESYPTVTVGKVSEKEFMAEVIAFAKRHGWLVYHTHDSRKSEKGFPDLILLKDLRLVVAELKVGTNQTTPEQRE